MGPKHLHCKPCVGGSDAGRPQAKRAGNSDLKAVMRFPPRLKHEGNKVFVGVIITTVESADGAKPRNKWDKNETG